MPTLNTPIEQITSIGKKIAPSLKKLGLHTAQDLLFYFPFRWEDWSQVKNIKDVQAGTSVTIKGQIELIQNKRSKWKKRILTEGIVADNTGQIKAIWFHSPYLIQNLKPGDQIFLSGKVDYSRDEGLQFIHPNYEKITKYKDTATHTARIVPIYSLTKKITAKQIRYLISQVIKLTRHIPEWLTPIIIKENKLIDLSHALQQIHFPDDKNLLNQALDRLKFNELFLIQLHAQLARQELKHSQAPQIKFHPQPTKQFVDSLPFKLTDAQRKSAWEILIDLEKNMPMNRLLEGDVGSGKTIVACLAILNVYLNQQQAALMAPTEILAKQHFNGICQLFKGLPINIGLLTSSLQQINFDTKTQRHSSQLGEADKNTNSKLPDYQITRLPDYTNTTKTKLHESINKGDIDLIIGTHALIQDKVNFSNLALIIVDEQHRFGVDQRKKLKHKNSNNRTSIGEQSNNKNRSTQASNQKSEIINHKLTIPHLLSMTATPIPRSLAFTVYGDLDLSIINQMPHGRKAIITQIVPPEKRPETYKFVLQEINAGHQIFVICPLIDPSDKLGVKAVKDEFKKLDQKIFPHIPIGLLHGKLKSSDKEKIMLDFLEQRTKILVSTPVIEVGIDIPNATVMLIESAERFGLAQLHQFRGRVGRSDQQSHCFLFTESETVDTIRRLQVLVKSHDGFKIAEHDLEFRGPGEIYGIKQSGFKDRLKVAKLTDYLIIKQSKKAVDQLLNTDPNLDTHPEIKHKLTLFNQNIHLE